MLDSERKWAISCYIPIFNIVMCALTSVRKVNSKFCLFHARQGLALFALWIFTILVALVSQTLSLMLWGVVLLLHGAGMFIAYSSAITKIPLLGQLAMKIPEYYLFELLSGKKPEVDKHEPEVNKQEPEVKPQNPEEQNIQNK